MREKLNQPLTVEGKSSNKKKSTRGKSFGYQVLGFGAGGSGPPAFIVATGGTVTESGNFRIHTFTGDGTFTVCKVAEQDCAAARNNVSYLVVAGGASGGSTTIGGGGGGAGGFREYRAPLSGCYSVSPLNGNPGGTSITVSAQGYPIVVGAGGASGPAPGNPTVKGNPGSVSTFDTVTSAGGGGGAADNCAPKHANPGGSGGGGYGASGTNSGGTGNTPPTSPAQGTNGGPAGGNPSNYANAGGGGGAICAGESITGNFPGGGPGGNGGNGATTSITASPVAYAGGGGASADNRAASRTGGDAGTGGGGQGGDPTRGPTSGTANTGGGGGGQHGPCSPSNTGPAGAGGSGIVIIRYQFQQENNMAHFAKISETNEVLTVHVVDNKDLLNADGVEDETVGQQYLEQHSNWPAHLWIQTSYNTLNNTHRNSGTPFRGNYAGIGDTWDEDNQIFWPKKPHASWVKHNASASWKSPIGDAPALTAEQQSQNTTPVTDEEGNVAPAHLWEYSWNEATTTWDLTDALA